MSRPTSHRTGGPGFGVSQNGSGVQREIHASLDVKASDARAVGLARALGVANEAFQPIAERKMQEMAAEAVRDGVLAETTDTVDEKRMAKESAYKRGATTARQKAALANAKQEWEAHKAEAGLADATPEEHDEALDAFIKSKFGYIAEEDYALEREIIVGDLAAWEIDRKQAFRGEMVEASQQNVIADTGVGLADAYKTRGKVTTEEVNGALDALAGVVGGARAKQEVTNMLVLMMMETGDPSIIDSVADDIALPDGSTIPGLRRDPKYAYQLESARRNAEDLQTAKVNNAYNLEKRQREADADALDLQIMQQSQESPDAARSLLKQGLAAGTLDAQRYRSIENFLDAEAREAGNADVVDWDRINEDELAVSNGTLSREEVLRRAAGGYYGSGSMSTGEARRLAGVAGGRKSAVNSMNTKMLTTLFPDVSDSGLRTPDRVAASAAVVRRYNELILAGETPDVALDKATALGNTLYSRIKDGSFEADKHLPAPQPTQMPARSPSAPSQRPTISSREEFDALPSGTEYIDSRNGTAHIKG